MTEHDVIDPFDSATRQDVQQDIRAMRTASYSGLLSIQRALIGLRRWTVEAEQEFQKRMEPDSGPTVGASDA